MGMPPSVAEGRVAPTPPSRNQEGPYPQGPIRRFSPPVAQKTRIAGRSKPFEKHDFRLSTLKPPVKRPIFDAPALSQRNYSNRLSATALPEPDLKYFSSCRALGSVSTAT